MSTINIDLAADTILNVMIGQQDENEVREVVFDFSGWYTTYGSGTISLAIQRPKDEWPYEGTLTVDSTNHKATWEISDTDTAYAGTGQIQLSYKVGDAKKKSVVYRFTCHKSLGALGSVVTPVQIQTFIDEVEEALQTMDGKLDDMEDEITDVKSDLRQITAKDQNITALSIWSNKRVTTDGSLTYSPSQLTSEEIFYIGKGNIIKITGEVNTRSLSISYYQYSNGEYNYIQSDITNVRFLKYVCAKYDYCRISFVGTSANPPVLTEFFVEILQTVNHEFYGKNIAFLGDSITTFSGISEGGSSYNAPYYPTGDVSYYEQTYGKMFWDACGGAAISVSAISNSSWRNQGQASCPSAYEDVRITRLSANGTPDYVFINMGTNDPYSSNIGSDIGYTYDVETLEANVVYSSYAIQTTIRKIQVAYPNAKIILLIPKFPSAIGTGNYTFEKWEKLCDFMIQIADMYGVYKIVDLRKCGISVETFATDCISSGMHPNFSGMKKMGSYIIKELLQA